VTSTPCIPGTCLMRYKPESPQLNPEYRERAAENLKAAVEAARPKVRDQSVVSVGDPSGVTH